MVDINEDLKDKFRQYLWEREYSSSSILKYTRNFLHPRGIRGRWLG